MNFKIFLVLSVVAVIECRRLTNEERTEAEKIIHSIPKHELRDFIAFALGLEFMEEARFEPGGKFPFPELLRIPKPLEEKFKSIKMPKNFSSDLYLFVKSTYQLTSVDMFSLILRRRICFPNGRCVDLENIGELCCPF